MHIKFTSWAARALIIFTIGALTSFFSYIKLRDETALYVEIDSDRTGYSRLFFSKDNDGNWANQSAHSINSGRNFFSLPCPAQMEDSMRWDPVHGVEFRISNAKLKLGVGPLSVKLNKESFTSLNQIDKILYNDRLILIESIKGEAVDPQIGLRFPTSRLRWIYLTASLLMGSLALGLSWVWLSISEFISRKYTKQSSTILQKFHIPAIDSLRFLAFTLVFFHHAPACDLKFLSYLHTNGWIGVDIFLVLSSFLITTLLFREREKKTLIDLKGFYIRRVLRIWPLLVFAIPINYFVLPEIIPSLYADFPSDWRQADINHHLIPTVFLFGNLSISIYSYWTFGYLGHLWTIFLEEQFYIFWPVCVKELKNFKPLCILCFFMLSLSFFFRLYFAERNFPHPAIWTSTLTRLDPFAMGCLIALVFQHHRAITESLSAFSRELICLTLIAISITALYFIQNNWSWQGSKTSYNFLFSALCIALFLTAVLGSRLIQGILSFPPMVFLGKISYGLYVYHFIFCKQIMWGKFQWVAQNILSVPLDYLWFFAFTMALISTIVVSMASYILLERPFLALKRKFEHIPSRDP